MGKSSAFKIQGVEPMYTLNAGMLPEGPGWLYEIKLDGCVWLETELVVQIGFTEWTPDDHLRHAAFVGLRKDKKRETWYESRSES